MNVFYCCCIDEPWLSVAKQLELEGFKASYWVGWKDGESKVRDALPNTIYHDINLAWKGIISKDLNSDHLGHHIDGSLFESIGNEELMAIKMMDRLDRDLHSFPFVERQLFFRKLFNQWYSVLKNQNIDLIIFPSIPHRVFDYVIYLVAQRLNIPFLTFKYTPFRGYLIPLISTITEIPNLTEGNSSNMLNEKVNAYFSNILSKSYEDVEPEYIQAQKKVASKSFGKRVFEKTLKTPGNIFHLFDTFPIFWKRKDKSLEESSYTRFQIYQKEMAANRYKKNLKKYYESIVTQPDYKKDYILVGLHYQPEATSIPSGNIYADQYLLIQSLLKHTEPTTEIYVKEHPSQFLPQLDGHTGRIKEFYTSLLKEKRVRFLPLTEDNFTLIEHSKAVATIISNIALEALVKGKPVILFGNAWYEHFHGALKITSQNSLNQIQNHIQEFSPNIELLKQQFSNTIESCLKANHYKRVAALSDISNEESISNLVDFITSRFSNE